MGGKVDVYVDCASPYSYFALVYLRKHRKLLEQYDVEVEFHSFFLGGVNVATGNKPPASLPAKAAYGPYDLNRAVSFFQTQPLSAPPFFPLFSVPPQRIMTVIKTKYPREKFETVYADLWIWVFNKHVDISKPEPMAELLGNHFEKSEVEEIMKLAGSQEFKDKLTQTTKFLIDNGAFGAPWIIMKNSEGRQEPIFGSDRWSYLFKFMGVEVRELEIVDKSGSGDARKGTAKL